MKKLVLLFSMVVVAPACGDDGGGDGDGDGDGDATASATFAGVNGQTVEGTATFTDTNGTVSVTVNITSAADGTHGMHIHETADCGGDGSNAGGHWDPTDNDPNNHDLPPGGHMGDLGNITISGGTGTLTHSNAGWTLGDGGANDVVPHAIIFHELEDDGTMPSAGARHGCALIALD